MSKKMTIQRYKNNNRQTYAISGESDKLCEGGSGEGGDVRAHGSCAGF